MSLCDRCDNRKWSSVLEARKRLYGERCKAGLEMQRTLCTEFRRREAVDDAK